MQPTLAIPLLPSIGFPELIVLGLVALLLFGKRLPEVGRSLGRAIVEFKKGLQGIEEDVRTSSTDAPRLENQRLNRPVPDTQSRQAGSSAAPTAATSEKP